MFLIGDICGVSRGQAVTTNSQKSADAILVKSNKGSGGIDRMEVAQLLPYLREHKGN